MAGAGAAPAARGGKGGWLGGTLLGVVDLAVTELDRARANVGGGTP